MEYEDTNILRTQYVEDLVNQRQNLENAMLYQESDIESGEGLSLMVPKVQALTGAKPSVPYFNVYRIGFDKNQEYIKNVNVYNMTNFDSFCEYSVSGNSQTADLTQLFFGKILSAKRMFYMCPIIKLPPSFKCEDVVDASSMFNMQHNKSIYIYNESPLIFENVENATSMFAYIQIPYATDALPMGTLNPIKITSKKLHTITAMFQGSSLFIDLKNIFSRYVRPTIFFKNMFKTLYTNNVIEASQCFRSSTLTEDAATLISELNFEKLEDASYMFNNINLQVVSENGTSVGTKLDLSKMYLPSVKKLTYIFADSTNLTEIIAPIVPFETVTALDYMIYGCSKLIKLDLSRVNMGAVTALTNTLYGSTVLQDVNFGYNLGKGFTNKRANYYVIQSNSTVLTRESCLTIFTRIYDLNITYGVYDENGNPGTGKLYTQKIDLQDAVIAKLTPEDIAIATNKGWTVA